MILAEQPVVVDTGAPLHRERWLDAVSSIVDPADVRWVFLSHDDGDHLGNMTTLLDRAPNAKVIANFFSNERAAVEPDRALPILRQVWLEEGTSFDAVTAGCTCSDRRSSTDPRHVASTTSAPG